MSYYQTLHHSQRLNVSGMVRIITAGLQLQAYLQFANIGSRHKWAECASISVFPQSEG